MLDMKFKNAKVKVVFGGNEIEYGNLIGIKEISKKVLAEQGDWKHGNGIQLSFSDGTTATFPKKGLRINFI